LNADLVFGLVALAVAATYYTLARGIPTSLLDDLVGSRGLPTVYAFALAGLALVQVARALVLTRAGSTRSETASSAVFNRKAIVTLALGVAYGALLPWLGYAASIAALVAATAAYQGAGFNRRVVTVAAGGAAFLWVLFVWLLGIPQPSGIWSSF
jgi:hypothetical protein